MLRELQLFTKIVFHILKILFKAFKGLFWTYFWHRPYIWKVKKANIEMDSYWQLQECDQEPLWTDLFESDDDQGEGYQSPLFLDNLFYLENSLQAASIISEKLSNQAKKLVDNLIPLKEEIDVKVMSVFHKSFSVMKIIHFQTVWRGRRTFYLWCIEESQWKISNFRAGSTKECQNYCNQSHQIKLTQR